MEPEHVEERACCASSKIIPAILYAVPDPSIQKDIDKLELIHKRAIKYLRLLGTLEARGRMKYI